MEKLSNNGKKSIIIKLIRYMAESIGGSAVEINKKLTEKEPLDRQ